MWIVLAAALLTSAMDVSAVLSAVARSAKVEARSAEVDKVTRVVTLPPGKSLAIEVTIGSVRIDGWDRPDAEITVERRAPSAAQLERIPIVIDDTPSHVGIRAIQADGTADPALRTDVVVRVPHLATIDRVQVMEGRIAIARFAGAVTADIRRGPIDGKDLSGMVRLESGIGSVVLTGTRLVPDGLLRLRAFNGDVSLTLVERPANARIMALALNGSITSDIPLTMKDTWGPRWGETTIGTGEPVISLDVVTGAIAIKAP